MFPSIYHWQVLSKLVGSMLDNVELAFVTPIYHICHLISLTVQFLNGSELWNLSDIFILYWAESLIRR